jgi:hypothetical protein
LQNNRGYVMALSVDRGSGARINECVEYCGDPGKRHLQIRQVIGPVRFGVIFRVAKAIADKPWE